MKFEDHQKLEHNIWNYVKFIVFIKNRTLKDCNGMEMHLQGKILSKDISFFPLNKSLSLGSQGSNKDSVVIQHKIQKIQTKLKKLREYLSKIQEKTNKLA